MNFCKYSNNSNLLYTSFNQTRDCVVFGTKIGFYVYTLDPFKKIIARKIPGGVSIVKMLYKSNIVLFVGNVEKGLYPKKKLIIWDDHKRTVIGEIVFKTNILNLKVTKDIIIVVTAKKIYIYNFKDLHLLKTIDTKNNINGTCCITYEGEIMLCYPGDKVGEVNITKCRHDFLTTIKAHINSIELFNIDKSGNYIVTTSELGTLIRLFEIKTGKMIKELRRGSDSTKIVDLKFSDDSKFLLCSSIKGTIHIFSTCLTDSKGNNIGIGYGMSYLQSMLPSYFSSEWSFIQFYLENIISYSIFLGNDEIITIGNNGHFYVLSFKNDEKKIIKTYKFISDNNDPFNNRTTTIK